MARRGNAYSAKKMAVCAMLSALGTVLLTVGAFSGVLEISMAVIASIPCIIAVIEYGGSAPWMVYGVTSVLSVLLVPGALPSILYALFFGFYPILKEKFEKKPRVISWVLKEVTFNISLTCIGVAAVLFTLTTDNALLTPLYIGIMAVLAEIVFVLYDIALTRLISIYIITLRKRFKF